MKKCKMSVASGNFDLNKKHSYNQISGLGSGQKSFQSVTLVMLLADFDQHNHTPIKNWARGAYL